MKEPSPLVPQGSFEAMARGKSHVRIAFYTIVAVHLLVIGGLLILGCKREESTELPADPAPVTNDLATTPPFGTDPAVVAPPPAFPPADTNLAPPPAVTSTTPPPSNVDTGLTTIPPTPPPVVLPPPTPAEMAPVEPATREHTIVKGDTFALLATKYGVSVRAIQSANPGVDPTRLKIGQKVKIPASSPSPASNGAVAPAPNGNTYVVKSGDNLGRIARANGTTVRELQRLNNLTTTQIRVGQKLKLPARPAPDGVAPAQ